MEIKVLGMGCAKCKSLEALVRDCLAELGLEVDVTKVDTMEGIMVYDVLSTPALVIDERVVSYGRLPSSDEVKGWLQLA